MRRSLFVLVLTGLVAASCSGSGGAPERDYDIAVRNAYLENCQYEGGDPSSCAVTLECIEEHLSQKQFEDEEYLVGLTGKFGAMMTGVLATCMARVSVAAPSTTSLPPSTSAAAPAGEGKIAFTSDRDGDDEVFVMNADGTGVTQLTDNNNGDGRPVWSPDGNKIAFASDRDGDYEIFVMNADGTGVTQLTDNTVWDHHPDWSPDGNKIAFVRQVGDFEIFWMDADGTGVTQLTDNDDTDVTPVFQTVNNRLFLAFMSDRDGDYSATEEDGDYEIFAMRAGGVGVGQLTDNDDWDGAPAATATGAKIAFMSNRDGDFEIFLYDGYGVTQLTDNDSDEGTPVWSPDGNKIAFGSNRNGDVEIFVMDADGNNQVSLGQQGQARSWVDGTTLAPISDLLEQTGQHQFFLVRDAGGSEVRLFGEISSCIPTGNVDDVMGWFYYRVDGSITNIGNDTFHAVHIKLYFNDESGDYLGDGYVDGPTDDAYGGFALGPGETKQFDQEVMLWGDVPFFTRVTCKLQDFEWR